MPAPSARSRLLAGGDIISRHRHDVHQLIYVSRGVLAVTTAHGSWVASGERALWIPAGTWHEHRFYGHSKFHSVGFPAVGAPLLPTRSPAVIAVDPLLRELLIALTSGALKPAEARHIRAVLRDRLHCAQVQPVVLPVPRDPRLAGACQIVEADLGQPRTLAWLARNVNAGERTLSRLFRAEFGMTYPQWRTRTRIFAAMVLLADGATVTDTAHACGWATTSAFVCTFSQVTGTTPGAHRTASRQTALPAPASSHAPPDGPLPLPALLPCHETARRASPGGRPAGSSQPSTAAPTCGRAACLVSRRSTQARCARPAAAGPARAARHRARTLNRPVVGTGGAKA